MSLTWHALTNFADKLYMFICRMEASSENERLTLSRVNGNPTIGAGFDNTTWPARVDFWTEGFMIIGAPLIAHYANQWLKHHWSVLRWHRYRWWLRVAEAIFIFLMLGRNG